MYIPTLLGWKRWLDDCCVVDSLYTLVSRRRISVGQPPNSLLIITPSFSPPYKLSLSDILSACVLAVIVARLE